ncbi:MAG TPA: hypothetical protein VM938_10775 [Acidimicrobiales bacterium]|nr:hypothetical protein [Acidimicrobiales bacterium]
MTILRAALRLQSAQRSCKELSALVGAEPTRCMERGAPVSSRNPDGPVRTLSTWRYESGVEDGTFHDHVTALAPLFDRLAHGVPDDVEYDLVVMAEGRSMGSLFELDVESLAVLHRAKSSITFDVYVEETPPE